MHPFNQFTQENTVFNSETTHVISVSDLNRTTRQLLEEAYGSIWIQGELSNVVKPRSGHIYFTLKDQTGFEYYSSTFQLLPHNSCNAIKIGPITKFK